MARLDPEVPQGYTDRDVDRSVPEPDRRPGRTPFARDRARLVHSAALRRLAAKTQVLGPTSDDFVRNRLTHSLEVAQVGRELGAALGCDPDLVETACLAHDIGHPPFGHNGERALAELAGPAGGFEGNAQTFRLLTRLEAKRAHPDGRSAGVNLTRASLDAATKYPWPIDRAPSAGLVAGQPPALPKFGVYQDDLAVFDWVREAAPGRQQCLEAQVMDWADDVAYSVHDVEDGIVGGAIPLVALRDTGNVDVVAGVARDLFAPDADLAELAAALRRLLALDVTPHRYDGGRVDLAALKDLTSSLIGRFCLAAERETRRRHGPGRLTRYAADLIVPREARLECAVLKGVAAHYVMAAPAREPVRQRQREVIEDLVQAVADGAPATMEPVFARDFAAAPDDPGRLRVVIDQVASLTDVSAIAWHVRLTRG